MTEMHRGCLAALVGALALIAACGDDDTAAPDTTAAEVTTTSTAVDETTTTTTIEDESPPELENTGDDFVAILVSLNEYTSWLGMHPEAGSVDLAYVPGSTAHTSISQIVEELATSGWHWSGPTDLLEDVEVSSIEGDRSVVLTATTNQIEDAVLLDVDGERVDPQPPRAGSGRLLYELALGDDGMWRIANIDVLEVFSE
jgi:hypothetical protein